MKNYKVLVSIMVLLVSISLITSCKKDDNPTASTNADDLVGTWVLSKVIIPSANNIELSPATLGVSATFNLKSDKTYIITYVDSSGTTTENGTWSVNNGTVTMTSTDGTSTDMPFSISNNTLTVETIYDLSDYGFGSAVDVKLELIKQ